MSSRHCYRLGEWSIVHMYAKGLKTEITVDDKGKNVYMNFNLLDEPSVHIHYEVVVTILPCPNGA